MTLRQTQTSTTSKMPQELQVLQCFNCETFQVDIVKKVQKWSCKMCGEKQVVNKVYGKGTGKECRLFVQSLNEKRVKSSIDQSTEDVELFAPSQKVKNLPIATKGIEFTEEARHSQEKRSKWSDFSDFTQVTQGESHSAIMTGRDDKNRQQNLEKDDLQGKSSDNIFEDENNDLDAVLNL